jgi:glycosyltransferase involved in cell wall biosynthesis
VSARIRVAAVMDTAIVSGPGRQLAAIVPALAEQGVDVRIVVFQHEGREKTAYRAFLEARGIDHVVIPFASRFDRRLVPTLRARLGEWRPDVVQTHSYRPTALVWLLRRAGVPWRWIGFFHGTTNEDLKVRVYHWLDRRLLPSADRIVVMSQAQIAHFDPNAAVVQVHNAVLPAPVAAIPDGTAAALARVAALPTPRIGVIGRISHEKGVDVAIHAARALRDRGTPATWVIAGDGPDRSASEALVSTLQLGDTVHFTGALLPIEPLYPLLDLVVIPSRSEGLPNVLLEALRADRPVVSTTVGAVPEVIGGTEAGRLVPVEDPAALAEGVRALLA